MNAALEAIYERAEAILNLSEDPNIRRIADEIIALSRYKFDVIGNKSGENKDDKS